MHVVDSRTMREMDAQAIESGVDSLELMERAGRGASQALLARPAWLEGCTLVVCGNGNNGGDGFVVARHLHEAGHEVRVLRRGGDCSEDARANLERAQQAGVVVDEFSDQAAEDLRRASGQHPGRLVVDAVLGTGLRPPIREPWDAVCAQMGKLGRDVVALDCPSGLDGDTGECDPNTPEARLTVTFGAPKWGMVLGEGRRRCGRWEVVDLDFPADVVEQILASKDNTAIWVDAERVWRWLVPPAVDRHKYDAGAVMVVGAARGMSGAVTLACHGALRGGAGLVEALVPESQHAVVDGQCVETLVHAAPETAAGTLGSGARKMLDDRLDRHGAVILGPGAGRDESTASWMMSWVEEADRPLVLDADGLNALAGADRRPPLPDQTILTPHTGELVRLIGRSKEEIARDRRGVVLAAARDLGAVLLHKGAPTFVAAPDGRLAVISSGGPGLATAGSGDVLAGLCGAFLAAAHEPFVAACLGAWVHGAAGDRVEALRGIRGTIASELPAAAALVLRDIESLPR